MNTFYGIIVQCSFVIYLCCCSFLIICYHSCIILMCLLLHTLEGIVETMAVPLLSKKIVKKRVKKFKRPQSDRKIAVKVHTY
uniref:Uncharacterized protein n=1 Tax=Rhizophora mucronata TaxID=61149 RepID=A0A2P2KI93_RHIMU